jgi:predicted O-methyltransferase YrrM
MRRDVRETTMTMNPPLRAVLADLEEEGRRHDAQEHEHSRKMLNLEPETARLLSILVRSSRRGRVLEIGTSNGYSTIWLAWAVGPAGHITSVDRDAHKQTLADANLRRAGLRDVVELLHGDATGIVATLPGPFDCVFFDADRRSAPDQLALLLPRLTPDALLLADNALSHPDESAGYLAALAALPEFEHIAVPIGKGLSVAYRGMVPTASTG